jgi:quercetin dioxygenase-like cupin family protein
MRENQPDNPICRFLDLAATALRAETSSLAQTVAQAIDEIPAPRQKSRYRYLPAADHFTAACALASDDTWHLVDAAAALDDQLQWRGGADHRFGDRKRGELAFVEFVGPTSAITTDNLRFGLFLLAPATFYPNHSHAADELYYVIAGEGEWQKDDGDFSAHGPGTLIEMPSFTPHALRTGESPVLMLYAWTGDVGGEYRIL